MRSHTPVTALFMVKIRQCERMLALTPKM